MRIVPLTLRRYGLGVENLNIVDLDEEGIAIVKMYPAIIPERRWAKMRLVRKVVNVLLLRGVFRMGRTMWEFVVLGRGFRPLCLGFLVAYPSRRQYLFAMCSDEELYCKLLRTLSMWAPEAYGMLTPVCPRCANSCTKAVTRCRDHPIEWMRCMDVYYVV